MLLAAVAFAGALAFFLVKSRRNYKALPSIDEGSSAAVSVTVIVPARNEEANIARVVSSFQGLPVVVVDDASSDRTGSIARQCGATVIGAPALTGARLGKPNACAAGAAAAETKWLLFVDADTWYSPGFASSLIAYAESRGLEMASVFPQQQRQSWAERILLPYAFALYFCGVSAKKVNSSSPDESLANGQCMLIRRDAYLRMGGHDAVAQSVIEDVAMAQLAKRSGVKAEVLRAQELAKVRMYSNFGEIWRGFQKNSFRFLAANPRAGVQVIAASVLLTSWIPMLAACAAAQDWLAFALVFPLPTLLLAPWYGGVREAMLAPLAIYMFQAIALNGMVTTLTRRKAQWKGRAV